MISSHLRNFGVRYSTLLEKNRYVTLFITFAFISIAALLIRLPGINYVSGDMNNFLLPWFHSIKQNGGLQALSEQTGDYNMIYQTIIALLTYIPANPVHLYKLISIAFDFALAAAVARFCFLLVSEHHTVNYSYTISLLAYVVILFTPTVFLNSSVWGQCDSIYTTLCVISLFYLYRNQLLQASVFFGIALSFKLQAVLIAPFICIFYLNYRMYQKKGFRAKDALLFIIPLVILWISGIVVYCYGRNPLYSFFIYYVQTGNYKEISMNCPNFWGFFTMLSLETQAILIKCALCICFVLLFYGLIYTLRYKILNDKSNFLAVATWFTWTAVMFLPKMHERYTFMIELLLIMLSFTNKRFVKYAIIAILVSVWSYFECLTGELLFPLYNGTIRSLIYTATYMLFTYSLIHHFKLVITVKHKQVL